MRRKGSMRATKTVCLDMDIRFRDIDAMGHVNNAVFFTYFEEGRKAFLEEVLGIVQPSDYPFIMARIECTFKAPLRLGDRPVCETWIRDVENRKFSFRYRVIDRDSADLIYAEGESIMVFYDYSAGRSVPISSEVKKRIHPYMELPAGDGDGTGDRS
jgi:acyl-CoA thioester hydrolase